ncbi:hypothetical protein D1872_231690 [compost metagenome]
MEQPTKFVGMDSDHKPGSSVVIHFNLRQKITAVYEIQAVHLPPVLRRVRLGQHHHRIVKMAAGPPGASDRLNAGAKRGPVKMAFPSPRARQLNKLKSVLRQIEAGAHQPVDLQPLIAAVGNRHRAGDHRQVPVNRIL